MKIDYEKSSIPANYQVNILENHSMQWLHTNVKGVYESLIAGIAEFLKGKKSVNKEKVAVEISNFRGEFKLGGIVEYHPEGKDDGNFSFMLTFDKAEVEGIEETYDISDREVVHVFLDTAMKIAAFEFHKEEYMAKMYFEAIDTLKEFLDLNAKEEEEVEVELPGYFTATVVVKDGEKVMTIVPSEVLRQKVKED